MVSSRKFITEGRAKPIAQEDPPRSPRETLPTMYDLPSEDPEEPGLPDVGASPSKDVFHDFQPQLLSRTLRLAGYSRTDYFTASDLNLYYDVHHPLWHKRPDWFLAVGVPRLYDGHDLRNSYVLWQEGKPPYVVVEFLSPGTEAEDLGRFYSKASQVPDSETIPTSESNKNEEKTREKPPGKLRVYEEYLRVPYYLVYSRYTQQLRCFKLDGGHYQEQSLNSENPLIWLTELEIGLGIWQGEFEGVTAAWLRWCDRASNWFFTDTEQAQQQLEQAQQAQEQAQTQLLQAAQNLLESGMAKEQVIKMLGLSAEQARSLSN